MDLEQRFQLVESELGLMKGEVRQILVDLRELVMVERQPFAGSSSRNGLRRITDPGPPSPAREDEGPPPCGAAP